MRNGEREFDGLFTSLLSNPYYEVRVAAILYLTENLPEDNYESFQAVMRKKMPRARTEEKIAYIKLISKLGSVDDLELLKPYFLHSNSLLREEILGVLMSYYKRQLLSGEEVKEYINAILITSNHVRAEFRLKQLIRVIYREIE